MANPTWLLTLRAVAGRVNAYEYLCSLICDIYNY